MQISHKRDANKNKSENKRLNDCSVQDQAELSQSESAASVI